MKRTAFFFSLTLICVLLFGCQAENGAAGAEEVMSESAATESEGALIEGEIATVGLSEKKGIDPVVYEEAEELGIFQDAFSGAVRQAGIVNMSAPAYYLKVVMKDGDAEYLKLWLGGEGEQSSLMNADDTHTIYSVTPENAAKLVELVQK